MHKTNIGIFKIAQTRVNWGEVEEWLEFLGVKEPREVLKQLYTKEQSMDPQFMISHGEIEATEASALIALCGKRCYNSFEAKMNPNVTKIREYHDEYIENILKSGHGSVLEHATWSFAIENISRVFTGEMNRHRAGVAISEASMRYIRFDDIGFTMPGSVTITPEEAAAWEAAEQVAQKHAPVDPSTTPTEHVMNCASMLPEDQRELALLAGKKHQTRVVFEAAFEMAEKINLDLCDIWKIEEVKDFDTKKKLTSMFRRVIGMGISTGGVWTLNARALRWVLQQRGSKHAEEEIYTVFDRIAERMVRDEPLLFGDFAKNEQGSWVPKFAKV